MKKGKKSTKGKGTVEDKTDTIGMKKKEGFWFKFYKYHERGHKASDGKSTGCRGKILYT